MSEKKDGFLKRAYRPLEFLLMVSMCIVFVVVLMEVVSRYIFNVSLPWVTEVSQTLLVWTTFIGAAVALLYKEHMVVNIIFNKVSSIGVRKAIELTDDLLILLFIVPGLIGGCKLVERTWNMTTTTLQIPAGIMYLAFPLGCALMVPVIVRDIMKILGKE